MCVASNRRVLEARVRPIVAGRNPASVANVFEQLAAEYGLPKEVNGDAEFEQAKHPRRI